MFYCTVNSNYLDLSILLLIFFAWSQYKHCFTQALERAWVKLIHSEQIKEPPLCTLICMFVWTVKRNSFAVIPEYDFVVKYIIHAVNKWYRFLLERLIPAHLVKEYANFTDHERSLSCTQSPPTGHIPGQNNPVHILIIHSIKCILILYSICA